MVAPSRLRGRQPRLLLAVLATRRGAVCTADQLADALWTADRPESAAVVLHSRLSGLRSALEPGRAPRAAGKVLRSVDAGYVLDLTGHRLDADEFAALVEEGRARLDAGDATAARKALVAALGLWRGAPFGELGAEPALVAAAADLDEQRAAAEEWLADARLRLGEHDASGPRARGARGRPSVP